MTSKILIDSVVYMNQIMKTWDWLLVVKTRRLQRSGSLPDLACHRNDLADVKLVTPATRITSSRINCTAPYDFRSRICRPGLGHFSSAFAVSRPVLTSVGVTKQSHCHYLRSLISYHFLSADFYSLHVSNFSLQILQWLEWRCVFK